MLNIVQILNMVVRCMTNLQYEYALFQQNSLNKFVSYENIYKMVKIIWANFASFEQFFLLV